MTTEESIQNRCPGSVIHRAGWVVIDPWTIYPNGFVRVENGKIQEIGQGTPAGSDEIRDYGSGVIFPALVNAHTHLELCALRGRISTHNGFGFWVKDLIEKRAQLEPRHPAWQPRKSGSGKCLHPDAGPWERYRVWD